MQRSLISLARNAAVRQPLRAGTSLKMMKVSSSMVNSRNFINTRLYSSEAAKEEVKDEETKQEAPEQTEIEQLQEKFSKKDKECAEMKDHYVRAIADFRNLQETTKREIQKAKDFALQKFARDLLESVDNFGHALSAVKEETIKSNKEVANLYEGVELTRNVFEKTLTRHGITKVDPLGEKFDPNLHEATFEMVQPGKEPGIVFHVQQPGYTLNSRVLRAAKVGIVKDPEN